VGSHPRGRDMKKFILLYQGEEGPSKRFTPCQFDLLSAAKGKSRRKGEGKHPCVSWVSFLFEDGTSAEECDREAALGRSVVGNRRGIQVAREGDRMAPGFFWARGGVRTADLFWGNFGRDKLSSSSGEGRGGEIGE